MNEAACFGGYGTGPRFGVAWMLPSLFAVFLLPAAHGFAADDDKPIPRAHQRLYDDATGQWVTPVPPMPGTPDGDLAIAREALAEGRVKEAAKRLKKWLKEYPDSPRQPEARFLFADAQLGRENFWKAYELYEEVIESYGPGEWYDRCLERELIVARVFLSGTKRKVLGGLFRVRAEDVAIDVILSQIRERRARSPIAEEALRIQADYHFQAQKFIEAEYDYKTLALEYPRSRFRWVAMWRASRSAIAAFPGVPFDDSGLVEAKERLAEFMREYPAHAQRQNAPFLISQIDQKQAEKEFETGRWYRKFGKRGAAAYYYRSVLQHWPDAPWAQTATEELASLGYDVPAALSETTESD